MNATPFTDHRYNRGLLSLQQNPWIFPTFGKESSSSLSSVSFLSAFVSQITQSAKFIVFVNRSSAISLYFNSIRNFNRRRCGISLAELTN